MLKCLQIEAKIFWLVEDSKVIFILFIVIIIPNIQLSRHQETKIQSLFKTTPQQLINLINLLPFWNQFNQTELMFSPLIAPSFPQVLYTLWKTYKQAKVFFSSKIRLKIPVACHLNGAVQVNNVNFPQPRLTHAPTCADYRRFSAKFRRFFANVRYSWIRKKRMNIAQKIGSENSTKPSYFKLLSNLTKLLC